MRSLLVRAGIVFGAAAPTIGCVYAPPPQPTLVYDRYDPGQRALAGGLIGAGAGAALGGLADGGRGAALGAAAGGAVGALAGAASTPTEPRPYYYDPYYD